jgi:hypothetical protein
LARGVLGRCTGKESTGYNHSSGNKGGNYWKLLIDLCDLGRWRIAVEEFKPFWLLRIGLVWLWLVSHGLKVIFLSVNVLRTDVKKPANRR